MAKTVQVSTLVEKANNLLASTEAFATKEFKDGICTMLETALNQSKSYKGFMFIDNEDCAIDTLGYFSRKYFI